MADSIPVAQPIRLQHLHQYTSRILLIGLRDHVSLMLARYEISFPSSLVPLSKRVQVRNHFYENDFDLHENETAGGSHFHMNGFAHRLVLKQRHNNNNKVFIQGFKQTLCGNGLLKVDFKIIMQRNAKLLRWSANLEIKMQANFSSLTGKM